MDDDVDPPEDGGKKKKSRFEKVVTNEAGLFLYRTLTGGAAILLSVWMHNLIGSNDELRVELARLNYTVSNQITALSGKVDLNANRLDAQSRRMDGFQSDLRDVNNRVNDYFVRPYQYGPAAK